MLTDVGRHNLQSRGAWRLRSAIGLALLAGISFSAAAIVLLIPNSVHLDTEYGDDIFFNCGMAFSPTTEPYEEPGISACREVTQDHRRVAGSLAVLGALSALVAGALIFANPRKSGSPPQRHQEP